MTIFRGSGVAIVTPFNEDGSVNFESYKNLVEFQIENGTDAIVTCGTTGEASTMTDEEQIEVISYTVEIVKGRVPVIAGVGSNDTKHAVHLSILAENAGADALLHVTPYYNRASQKGLINHYTTIAKSTNLPIVLYSVATRTTVNIEPKTVYELSKIPNITAIKEASGNIGQVAEIAALCGDNIDIYSGNDKEILPVLSLGGKGVISVVANIAPKQTHELVMKYLHGDLKGALDLQLGMLSLVNSMFCDVNPIPVKEALNMMNLNGGYFRGPLCEMEEKERENVRSELKAYGLI